MAKYWVTEYFIRFYCWSKWIKKKSIFWVTKKSLVQFCGALDMSQGFPKTELVYKLCLLILPDFVCFLTNIRRSFWSKLINQWNTHIYGFPIVILSWEKLLQHQYENLPLKISKWNENVTKHKLMPHFLISVHIFP